MTHLLSYFPLLLLVSVFVLLGALLLGVRNKRAVLLIALSLPGAIAWIVVLLLSPPSSLTSIFAILLVFPSSWILPLLVLTQIPTLYAEPRRLGLGTYSVAALVTALYVQTAVMNRGHW